MPLGPSPLKLFPNSGPWRGAGSGASWTLPPTQRAGVAPKRFLRDVGRAMPPAGGPGGTDLQRADAITCDSVGNVASYTTALAVDPPANSRLVAVCRAGRNNHTTAYAWAFTASGGLGAMTVAWSGVEWPAAGNNFAREMAIAYVDVGPSPPTGVTVTVDAWATADTGAYGVAVFCVSGFNAGAWLPQTPTENYQNPGAESCSLALAAASTGQTFAVAFAEDSNSNTVWLDAEAGWDSVAHHVSGYYSGNILRAVAGDADGATIVAFRGASNNTAQAVIFEVAAAGGTTPLNVSGAVASSGVLARQDRKALAGSAASSGALVKQAQRAMPLGGAVLSFAGALARQDRKALAGTLTSTGTLSTVKAVLRAFAGTVTSTGALSRQTSRTFAGTATSAAQVTRRPGKALAGAVTSSGTLSTVKAVLRAFAGTLTSAGSLTRQGRKALAGSAASTGILTRVPAKALSGVITMTGAVTRARVALLAVGGQLSSSATLVRRLARTFAGTATSSGTLTRRPGKAIAGTVASSGALARGRLAVKALAGTLAPSGLLTKRTARTFAGSVATAGDVARLVGKLLVGALASSGAVTAVLGGVEPWSWYLSDGTLLRKSTPKLGGTAGTTTDVGP